MKKDLIAIKVEGLTKSFKIPLDGSSGIKQKIINITRNKKGYRKFTPLNDISFTIKKGEFFGIVGKNGSGKSTLLKSIAGIYTPEKGAVHVNGLLVPFIELGVGFNPELTGRENVYLNAALLGFSRKETVNIYKDIVDFAELHEFMEEQLKNYSSGMQVRLAFSIAIQAKGDVLLLDEVLAVGDAAFQQKCFDYFEYLKKENKTIILVTHSMDAVKRFCNRAMLIEKGRVKIIGDPAEVADQYSVDNIDVKHKKNEAKDKDKDNDNENEYVSELSASIDKDGYERNETAKLTLTYRLKSNFIPAVGLTIVKDGRSAAEINSRPINIPSQQNSRHSVSLDISLNNFTQGLYSIDIVVFIKDTMRIVESRRKVVEFVVKDDDRVHGGVIYLHDDWVAVD